MKIRYSTLLLSLIALTSSQALKSCPITITNDMHDAVHLKGNGNNSLSVSLKPHQSFTVKTGNKHQTHFHVVTHDHKAYKVQENFCKAQGNKLNVSKIIKLSALSPATSNEHAHRFTVEAKGSKKASHQKEVAKNIVHHHLKAMHKVKKAHHQVPAHGHKAHTIKAHHVHPIHGHKARHAHHAHPMKAIHHNHHGKKA